MATHYPPQNDPFADESAPSLSFKDAPEGTMYSGVITRRPHLVPMRDFENQQPKTWPDGNPVMGVVLNLEVNELHGETRSVWAQKPSSMFAALARAQKNAGSGPMEEGGKLYIKFVKNVPNVKSPHLNPRKEYDAIYEPPTPQPEDTPDAFAEKQAQQAQQTRQAPVQPPLPQIPPAQPPPRKRF